MVHHILLFIIIIFINLIQSTGQAGCTCLGQSNVISLLNGYTNNSSGNCPSGIVTDTLQNGKTECYPVTYGGECNTHDLILPPTCSNADGSINTYAPSWCNKSWCYIDHNSCNISYSKSSMYTAVTIYFSYKTCGSTNTWSDYSGAAAVESLAGVVDEYVRDLAHEFERYHKLLQTNEYSTVVCDDVVDGCACTLCSQHTGWDLLDSTRYSTDYCPTQPSTTECSTLLLDQNEVSINRFTSDPGSDVDCMAGSFRRLSTSITDLEYDDATRIGYIYMGHQETGDMIQWPAQQWCSATFDPRYRDWYSAAASGPKDIMLIIDVSGSMGTGNRISLAIEASKAVLDTLIYTDYVNILLFDDGVYKYDDISIAATDANIQLLKTWIDDNVYPKGGTNFYDALTTAFDMYDKSRKQNATSKCKGAFLFLTDGEADWDDNMSNEISTLNNEDWNISIFTYALGSGADTTITKRIACENKGIFHHVADDADLKSIMASYYMYFAAGATNSVDTDPVTWLEFDDWVTGETLITGCLAHYDRDGQLPTLVGVVCMDVNILVSLTTLKAKADYADFDTRIKAETGTCTPLSLTEDDIEYLRSQIPTSSKCDNTIHVSGGVIAGIVIGCLVAVAILCIVIYKKCFKKTSAPVPPPPVVEPPPPVIVQHVYVPQQPQQQYVPQQQPYGTQTRPECPPPPQANTGYQYQNQGSPPQQNPYQGSPPQQNPGYAPQQQQRYSQQEIVGYPPAEPNAPVFINTPAY